MCVLCAAYSIYLGKEEDKIPKGGGLARLSCTLTCTRSSREPGVEHAGRVFGAGCMGGFIVTQLS